MLFAAPTSKPISKSSKKSSKRKTASSAGSPPTFAATRRSSTSSTARLKISSKPKTACSRPTSPSMPRPAESPRRATFRSSWCERSSRDREIDAETARRLEGESLARWLKEQILGKATILNARGETVSRAAERCRHFAAQAHRHPRLFGTLCAARGFAMSSKASATFMPRKKSSMRSICCARWKIPYDRLALVGVLRSPLGGLTDQQIYELHRQNLLDYRAAEKLDWQRFSRRPSPSSMQALARCTKKPARCPSAPP